MYATEITQEISIYRWTTVGVYICSLVGMIIFTFTLDNNVAIYVVYFTAGLLG